MATSNTQHLEQWTGKALGRDEILERLQAWRATLEAFKAGRPFGPMTLLEEKERAEIMGALDRWLDELGDLRGR